MANIHRVFMTGATGYIGRRLIPALHAEGHEIIALVREQSRSKLPWMCTPVIGDALNGDSYCRFVEGADTFIQLVGVPHPSPSKAAEFKAIDLKAGLEAMRVARSSATEHFVYLSVAQPAPVMQAYQAVRAECERAISANGLTATVLRPWYVLGPGHWWPYCLLPFYKIAERIPRTSEAARRLGLISIGQAVRALVQVVNGDLPAGMRVLEVSDIRRLAQKRSDFRKRAHGT